MSEAITNVGHHAYPSFGMGTKKARKKWWVSASYHSADRKLTVMFYDQGTGIPNTIQNRGWYENLRSLVKRWADSRKIRAAMVYGRSSTDKVERGKGFQNLLEFAKVYDEGVLSIYSLRGLYRKLFVNGRRPTKIERDHKNSIGGTLIEWSVKL